jgi:hypothetical protein
LRLTGPTFGWRITATPRFPYSRSLAEQFFCAPAISDRNAAPTFPQFSSFNSGDRNSAVFGSAADRAWQQFIAAALRVMGGEPDPSGGATFYFDQTRASNPPKWASIYSHTTDIGAFHF